jgi:RNA polymerase sigma-70 factor (ECF subfamily)
MLFGRDKRFDKENAVTIELLLNESVKGNNYAIKRLINDYYAYAYKICILYSKTVEDAEEHINDGFVKIVKGLPNFDQSRSFLSWIRKIFINTCLDSYKSNTTVKIIPIDNTYDVADNERIISDITSNELLSMINLLPDYCKSVFLLYILEGMSHKEIGHELNISEGTSKSHLRDARIKLQNLLEEKTSKESSIKSKIK